MLCEEITALLQQVGNGVWKPWEPETPIAKILECRYPWGSLQWADNTVSVRRCAQSLLNNMCDEFSLLRPLQQHFVFIFQENLPPRVRRFATLQAYITDKLVLAFASAILAEVKPRLEHIVESTLAALYLPQRPLSADTIYQVEHLHDALVGCIISHFIEAMDNEARLPKLLRLPEFFKLEEAQEVQAQRAELHAIISRLQTAHSQISYIEDAFNSPESSSAALAAAVDAACVPNEVAAQHHANRAQSATAKSAQQSFSGVPTAVAARKKYKRKGKKVTLLSSQRHNSPVDEKAASATAPATPTLGATATPVSALTTPEAVDPTALDVAELVRAETSAVITTPASTNWLAPSALYNIATSPAAKDAAKLPKEGNAAVAGAQAGKLSEGGVHVADAPAPGVVAASVGEVKAELEDFPVSPVAAVADSCVHVEQLIARSKQGVNVPSKYGIL